MRRIAVVFLALGMALAIPGIAAADHPGPTLPPLPLPSSDIQQGGEGAEFELIKTLVTGNPHTDLDFFTKDGATYASVGTLAVGLNDGGQTIVKLTDDTGEVSADTIELAAGHNSAQCLSDPNAVLGLQHDVEASPKGTFTNATDVNRSDGDAQILLDATDARGRCHDQGLLGLSEAPLGGLEIIDVTDVENPVEIGLTTHIGQAHTVNVDPRRPHIAYAVSSDRVAVDENGKRANENRTSTDNLGRTVANGARFSLDGWEVMDLSSCMYFPPGTSVDDKRTSAAPRSTATATRPSISRSDTPTRTGSTAATSSRSTTTTA